MSEVLELADRLRTAGNELRQRPEEEVIAALSALLDRWREPGGPWQDALATRLAEHAGFSQSNVRDGLRLALADWNEAGLRRLVARELGDRPAARRHGFALTSILCAGVIPMPTLLQIVLSLLVRSPALVKPASRDPVTPSLVLESLAAIDADLAACIGIVSIDRRDEAGLKGLLASECIVSSGADATIEAVQAQLSGDQRFVGYGHRFSIAVLADSALDSEHARLVALDVSLWDQLGCMSPVEIYVLGGDADARAGFARALADALRAREEVAPLGEIDAASASLVRHERDTARMRLANGGAGQLYESEGLRWTVVEESDAAQRPTPLHRFVRIVPVANERTLEEALAPRAHQLSSAALAGCAPAIPALAQARRCQPGQMQAPPLDAPHDGQPLLAPLLR